MFGYPNEVKSRYTAFEADPHIGPHRLTMEKFGRHLTVNVAAENYDDRPIQELHFRKSDPDSYVRARPDPFENT
jgi:hypothetical protein